MGQTRRVAQQLFDIFPVEPVSSRPLCFTIAGHFLPNAQAFKHDRGAADEEATAAVFSFLEGLGLEACSGSGGVYPTMHWAGKCL